MSVRGVSSWLVVAAGMMLSACSTLGMRDPPNVTVAGFQPLQGQGFEMRMLVKLRVQNPNDSSVDYDGISLKIDVQGNTFATGVSDERGTVPRFGESVAVRAPPEATPRDPLENASSARPNTAGSRAAGASRPAPGPWDGSPRAPRT